MTQDVYGRLGVQRVVNAAGRLTMLGGSALSREVAEAMAEAGQGYVRLADLHDRAGELIAGWTGAEAACVTTGAAAGIALMVAACTAGTDPAAVERLPDVAHDKRDVLVQIGHLVSFGAPVAQMIRLGGGRPVAVGWANGVRRDHLESAIGPTTAAFLYVQSHHTVHHGMLPLETCLELCRAHGVPFLLDAAAEEDLRRYVAMGVDAVAYSGGKAFGGPTSGFVAGRRELIAGCRAQERGIGRPMKVGKEAIVGLLVALERYAARDDEVARAEHDRQLKIVERLARELRDVPGIRVETIHDEAGRRIVRAAVHVDPSSGRTAADLATFMADGTTPVYLRGHHAPEGYVAVDPRPIDARDVPLIVERIREFVK
ncbi:MAG TPA: DgaE family pyridoxal phosphate-dependent ammonia lyase [Chloroflexota bacterium]|nr:DgaE family pyridoxal phosphate-dependent ammonia lyase [Chloroflexota bacterium]